MFKLFVTVCALIAAQPVFAANVLPLHGLWQLVSYEVEVQATGQKQPVMGRHPSGYATFTPEGRVFFVFTGEGRQPGKTAQERAKLLDTLIAYTGTYRVEGDQWITHVEAAWNPEWVGTEQRRTFKVEGNRLRVLTPWRIMPNWAARGMTRSIITMQRAQ